MRKQKDAPETAIFPPEDPALTPEARENQLISLAERLAEKQLREGTASSQVITHYLKLGTAREKLECEKIRHENDLLEAKRDAINSAKNAEQLFADALAAFKSYRGDDEEDYSNI